MLPDNKNLHKSNQVQKYLGWIRAQPELYDRETLELAVSLGIDKHMVEAARVRLEELAEWGRVYYWLVAA